LIEEVKLSPRSIKTKNEKMNTKSIISTAVILCIAAVNSFAAPPTEESFVKGSNGAVYVILGGKPC
jgi:hypothetical protein